MFPPDVVHLRAATGRAVAGIAGVGEPLSIGRNERPTHLPDWPAPGKVDGSAHVVGERGLVFLFHPSKTPLQGEFALTEERIGLKGKGNFRVTQEYPQSDRSVHAACGKTIRWEVPGQAAVILRVESAE